MTGRPTKFSIIYGLTDGDGSVFYVGQTKNMQKRMAAYRAGSFHGNRDLAEKVFAHGVRPVVLREGCENLTAAEFEEIAARKGLVNLITSEAQALRYAKSNKPWRVVGAETPSAAYMRHMRNAFGVSCDWLKQAIKAASDGRRMEIERGLAAAFDTSSIGQKCRAWVGAVDARA
jgi:predicted GIY-YIG superfamily endonuclease